MGDIAFEHFDPQVELGNLDENGKPIRPRKKPGRKPNPPSPAQRKAQNRAAQRAFRERKRREMREAEATVKRCLQLRDQALREANMLRRKVEELQYENRYLKGYVLKLKLACHANRVDVPDFTDTGDRDHLGVEKLLVSQTKGVPQTLEFFLDKDMHIVTLESKVAVDSPATPTHNSSPSTNSSFTDCALEALLTSPQLMSNGNVMPGSFNTTEMPQVTPLPPLDLTQTVSVLAPQLQTFDASQLDSPLFQQLLHTDLMSNFIDQITRPDFTIDRTPPELTALIPPEWRLSLQNYNTKPKETTDDAIKHEDLQQPYNDPLSELWASEPTIDHQGSTVPLISAADLVATNDDEEDDSTCVLFDESMSDEPKIYPPMSPIEYVNLMRRIRKASKKNEFLEPTELQRNVPHDVRIDVIPGATMRDQMILFQDFYDADELFNSLIRTATFLGGSPGNPDHWFVPPSFLRKYWFLCPNTKPVHRLDNSVEIVVHLGKQLQEKLVTRKQMYLERERFPDYFPAPSLHDIGVKRPDSCASYENESDDTAVRMSSEEHPPKSLDLPMDTMASMPQMTACPPAAFSF